MLKRYERVCFTREAVRPLDKPGTPFAEQHGNLLRQGAILVDPADEGKEPHLLFLLTHEIKSGDDLVLSKRLQFVRVALDGSAAFAGWAPHLDLESIAPADRVLLKDAGIRADQEQRALAIAAATLRKSPSGQTVG